MRTIAAAVSLAVMLAMVAPAGADCLSTVAKRLSTTAEDARRRTAGGEIDNPLNRLIAEILKLDTQPCGTPLYLIRARTAHEWSVTCEGCAALPVREVFPREDMTPVIEFAEEMKNPRGRVDINDMYLLAGRCSAKHLKW